MTEFGRMLRIIRINKGETAKDMAHKLNISPSYLSAMENGKRNIPLYIGDSISDIYGISDEDKQNIKFAIINTNESIKLDMSGIADKKKEIVVLLMSKDVNEDTLDKIYGLLN